MATEQSLVDIEIQINKFFWKNNFLWSGVLRDIIETNGFKFLKIKKQAVKKLEEECFNRCKMQNVFLGNTILGAKAIQTSLKSLTRVLWYVSKFCLSI